MNLLTTEEIVQIIRGQAEAVVDYDFSGKPIKDADVMLMGAYGPLVLRACKAVEAAVMDKHK